MRAMSLVKIALCFYFAFGSASAVADSGGQPLPEVACRYEMRLMPNAGNKTGQQKPLVWYFWRQAGMIQTRSADGDYGEIWQRTGNGGVQYRKLYHADKTAVEYMPGDTPVNHMDFDWFKLAGMLSPQQLDGLKLRKTTRMLGRLAELRQGGSGGQTLEVLWLMQEKLPARIVRTDKGGRQELRLTAITPMAQAAWQPISLQRLADYRHIDAADFGDMENDPFVKKLLAGAGHQ